MNPKVFESEYLCLWYHTFNVQHIRNMVRKGFGQRLNKGGWEGDGPAAACEDRVKFDK